MGEDMTFSVYLLPDNIKICNMKYVKILSAVLLAFMLCSAFTMKKSGSKPVFAFGVAASFTDSVVYFTEIQVLDSVRLKDSFLPNRDSYSYQLENYVEGNGLQTNSTCMIYFSENQKKLEKESVKLFGRYQKVEKLKVEKIGTDKFRFVKPREE